LEQDDMTKVYAFGYGVTASLLVLTAVILVLEFLGM